MERKNHCVEDALRCLRPGDTIAVGAYFHDPQDFLAKLHLAAAEIPGLTLWTANATKDYPIMREACDKINWLSIFYEKNARAAHPKRQVTYYPSDLHRAGEMMVASQPPRSAMKAKSQLAKAEPT